MNIATCDMSKSMFVKLIFMQFIHSFVKIVARKRLITTSVIHVVIKNAIRAHRKG